MWADGDTSESPLTIVYLVSLSFQVSQNRGKQCCSTVLSFDNNNTINLSAATTGFIFPNDHSQQQQQQQSHPRIYSDPQNPNLFFFLHHPGGGYNYQRQQSLHTFTFGGTIGGLTTPENEFLSPDSRSWSVSDAPRDHRQYHNEYDDVEPCRWDWWKSWKSSWQSLCPGYIQNWYNTFVSPKLRESDSVLTFLF